MSRSLPCCTVRRSDGQAIPVVVDATGDLLMNVLAYRPFLIKPNNDELSEMLGSPMDETDQIIEGAKAAQKPRSQERHHIKRIKGSSHGH